MNICYILLRFLSLACVIALMLGIFYKHYFHTDDEQVAFGAVLVSILFHAILASVVTVITKGIEICDQYDCCTCEFLVYLLISSISCGSLLFIFLPLYFELESLQNNIGMFYFIGIISVPSSFLTFFYYFSAQNDYEELKGVVKFGLVLTIAWLDFISDVNYVASQKFSQQVYFYLSIFFLFFQSILHSIIFFGKGVCCKKYKQTKDSHDIEDKLGYYIFNDWKFGNPFEAMLKIFLLLIFPAIAQINLINKISLWNLEITKPQNEDFLKVNYFFLLEAFLESLPLSLIFIINFINSQNQIIGPFLFSLFTSSLVLMVMIYPIIINFCRFGKKGFYYPHGGVFPQSVSKNVKIKTEQENRQTGNRESENRELENQEFENQQLENY